MFEDMTDDKSTRLVHDVHNINDQLLQDFLLMLTGFAYVGGSR